MTTCDALRCLRPTDPDEAELRTVEVFICAATRMSPEEWETRELHSVCLMREEARAEAREGQREAAMCVTDDRDVS